MKKSVATFAGAVSEKDVQGWVEHCDKFCRAVVDRDVDVLEDLTISLLPVSDD